jgi:hypothetical protein
MTDVLFCFDVEASTEAALEALKTGRVAYTWDQIMVRLKEYAETGRPDPVFA